MAKATPEPDKSRSTKAVAKPYEPTEAEAQLMQADRESRRKRLTPPKIKILEQDGDAVSIAPDHQDPAIWAAKMANAFGTMNGNIADHQAALLMMP